MTEHVEGLLRLSPEAEDFSSYVSQISECVNCSIVSAVGLLPPAEASLLSSFVQLNLSFFPDAKGDLGQAFGDFTSDFEAISWFYFRITFYFDGTFNL
jgi:hypothetical protein